MTKLLVTPVQDDNGKPLFKIEVGGETLITSPEYLNLVVQENLNYYFKTEIGEPQASHSDPQKRENELAKEILAMILKEKGEGDYNFYKNHDKGELVGTFYNPIEGRIILD